MLLICGISGYGQQLKVNYKDSCSIYVNRKEQYTEQRGGIVSNRSMSVTSLKKTDSLRNLREKQSAVNSQHSSVYSNRRTRVDSTNATNSNKRR